MGRTKGTNKADVFDGFPTADNYHGRAGNDKISGAAGNDKLYGDSGTDEISGDTGNDTIDGGSGNDIINGGGDTDRLKGGSGHDTFVYYHMGVNDQDGDFDIITDFAFKGKSQDFIDLRYTAEVIESLDEVKGMMVETNGDVQIVFDDQSVIVIESARIDDFRVDHFYFA